MTGGRHLSLRALEIEKRIRQIQADTTRDQEARGEAIDDLLRAYIEDAKDSRSSSIDLLLDIAEQTKVIVAEPVTLRRPEETPTRPSPAALADSRHEPSWAPEKPLSVSEETMPASGPRVLVIDDDPDVRASLMTVLEEEGIRVWQAVDGIDGLKRLFDMPRPDVILLDLMMPRASGADFIEVFDKTPYADVPLVIISAGRPPAFADERFVFLGKPLDSETLIATVRQHIAESRTRRV